MQCISPAPGSNRLLGALPNMDDTLKSKVLDWIEKAGFSLEMQAGNSFQGTRFDVNHSDVYEDPESGTSREIDLVAFASDSTKKFAMFLLVECKSCDKPWVVFKGQSQDYVGSPEWLYSMSQLALSAPTNMSEHVDAYYDALGLSAGGHSLRLAFSGQNDIAYAASMNALKASIASASFLKDVIAICMPIIVVNSPIFEYEQFANGDFKITEVEESAVKFGAHLDQYRHALIRVTSIGNLPRLISKLDQLFDANSNIYFDYSRRLSKRGT